MNVSALSLRDLEYVVAVDDERHFGRAALACAVSQPALSAQIRKLEDALEVPLFERTSRRVLPTVAGEAVIRQARRVLAEAQTLITLAQSRERDGMAGRFALGAIQTLGPYLFPLVLRGLRDAFPRLSFGLSEGRTADLLDALRDGRIDAALLSPPFDEGGLSVEPLFVEPFLLACPADHALATRERLDPASLAGPDLLLLDEGNCLRDQAIAACDVGTAGRHATSLETLRSMVAAGAGYTLLPRLAAREGPDSSGLLVCRPFPDEPPGRTIAIVGRSSDPRGGILAALGSFFRAHMPDGTVPARAPVRTGHRRRRVHPALNGPP